MKTPELFALIQPTLKRLDVDYAVGGAVAMAAHGYVRETTDLDVFFKSEDQNEVLRAMRKRHKVVAIADPFHFCIFPNLRNLDERIDLLFTSIDLERDAVEFPDNAEIRVGRRKLKIEVFPLSVLVSAKLASDRPKDHSDVERMFEMGLFDPRAVRKVLEQNDEEDALQRLVRIVATVPKYKRRR